MKNFTPFLLIAFILWVAFKDQLSQYLTLATTINWHIQLPWIFGGSSAQGGGSSAQGGNGGGGGGVLGAIGNEFGFGPSVLGNTAGSLLP
jgi:hypothetical protein